MMKQNTTPGGEAARSRPCVLGAQARGAVWARWAASMPCHACLVWRDWTGLARLQCWHAGSGAGSQASGLTLAGDVVPLSHSTPWVHAVAAHWSWLGSFCYIHWPNQCESREKARLENIDTQVNRNWACQLKCGSCFVAGMSANSRLCSAGSMPPSCTGVDKGLLHQSIHIHLIYAVVIRHAAHASAMPIPPSRSLTPFSHLSPSRLLNSRFQNHYSVHLFPPR